MGKQTENELYEYIGSKIEELRKDFGGRGLSQDSLAKAIKTQPNTISRWENATYKPKVEDLEKLANFFSVPISIFFPNTPTESPELKALMSATANLHKKDLEELTKFALFRKARKELKNSKK
jgi:transcriptional regulator with XRE-family HTH domain